MPLLPGLFFVVNSSLSRDSLMVCCLWKALFLSGNDINRYHSVYGKLSSNVIENNTTGHSWNFPRFPRLRWPPTQWAGSGCFSVFSVATHHTYVAQSASWVPACSLGERKMSSTYYCMYRVCRMAGHRNKALVILNIDQEQQRFIVLGKWKQLPSQAKPSKQASESANPQVESGSN